MLVDLGQEGKEEQLLNASGLDVILHKVLLLFSIDYSKFVHSEMDQNTNIMITKKVKHKTSEILFISDRFSKFLDQVQRKNESVFF